MAVRRHGPADRALLLLAGPQGEHPRMHLRGFRGILQADGYAGFAGLYGEGRVVEAACLAHARRKFWDVHEATKSPLARAALDRIAALYRIEDTIRGRPPDQRLSARKEHAAPLMAGERATAGAAHPHLPLRRPGAAGMTRESTMRTLRRVRWAALGLIVLLAIGLAVLEFRSGGEPEAEDASTGPTAVSIPAGVAIGGPFHLLDDKGRNVTDLEYRGRWMLVFFGYTDCPDECPLTLQKMAATLGKLGLLADQVAPLFITVDPVRDTPARLASYLENFDPRIIGLTGNNEQIAAATKAYHVYYAPAEHEQSGADLVSHSTFLYLMDPAGQFAALLPSDVDAEKLAAVLRARLASQMQAARPN